MTPSNALLAMAKALEAVALGQTVQNAATAFRIDPKLLQNLIDMLNGGQPSSGRRRTLDSREKDRVEDRDDREIGRVYAGPPVRRAARKKAVKKASRRKVDSKVKARKKVGKKARRRR